MRFFSVLFGVLGALGMMSMIGCDPGRADAESAAPADVPAARTPVTAEHRAELTIALMLKLAEAGNWGAYVDQYYGEAHKLRTPADRDALVNRFETKWGESVLGALRRAATVTPVIDTRGRALFLDGDEPVFMLYPHDDGRWTFHL